MAVTFERDSPANTFIFSSLFGNPVDMVRVASLVVLNGKEILGVAGAARLRFLGGEVASVLLLIAGLVAWVVAPFALAQRLVRRQDIRNCELPVSRLSD
jgi:hypothetical protein